MKATAGERFAMKWFNVTLKVLVDWEDGHKLVKSLDILLARERRKVAEDVLAMVANTPPNVTFDKIAEDVRAKYGTRKGK